jgi:hypothetical protein
MQVSPPAWINVAAQCLRFRKLIGGRSARRQIRRNASDTFSGCSHAPSTSTKTLPVSAQSAVSLPFARSSAACLFHASRSASRRSWCVRRTATLRLSSAIVPALPSVFGALSSGVHWRTTMFLLIKKARAYGIILILLTQNPDAPSLPT